MLGFFSRERESFKRFGGGRKGKERRLKAVYIYIYINLKDWCFVLAIYLSLPFSIIPFFPFLAAALPFFGNFFSLGFLYFLFFLGQKRKEWAVTRITSTCPISLLVKPYLLLYKPLYYGKEGFFFFFDFCTGFLILCFFFVTWFFKVWMLKIEQTLLMLSR